MPNKYIIGALIWLAAVIAIHTNAVTPGIGAVMLLVAVLVALGPILLRLLALGLDIITGV